MFAESNPNPLIRQQYSKLRWFLKLASVSCCILFFNLPLLHDIFPRVRELAPHGVAQISPELRLTRKNFVSRNYQRKAEQLAKKRSGLWLPFTLLGNEILLQTFNQITPFHSDSVFMGRDGQLVQTAHLSAFNRMPQKTKDERKFLERLKALKFFQDHQAKQGKSVIAVISPNVTELYPETVLERYIEPGRSKRESQYERFKHLADRLGINYVDGPRILIDAKQNYPFRMYARTGSHWNDVASCLVLQQLNAQLLKAGTASLPNFNCAPWKFEYPPRDKDLDLLKIANLLLPYRLYEPAPYVEFTPIPDTEKRPVITMAGSSYLFAFAENFKKRNLSEDHVHYFYYRQRKSRNSRRFTNLDRKNIPWEIVLNRDITIVEAPMRAPSALGYGFIDDAVRHIKASNAIKK